MEITQHWSKEEEQVLLDAIAQNPYNLTTAFKVAERQLPRRSFKSVSNRWYKHLRYRKVTFTLKGVDKKVNTKTIPQQKHLVVEESVNEATVFAETVVKVNTLSKTYLLALQAIIEHNINNK